LRDVVISFSAMLAANRLRMRIDRKTKLSDTATIAAKILVLMLSRGYSLYATCHNI
jgi:hypothetical protein